MSTEIMTYEEIARLALNLPPEDKLLLIERLSARVRYDMQGGGPAPEGSLRGLLADLGPAPSAEEIDQARRELWETYVGKGKAE